jgi:cytochrome c-type biogenesis protein CcmE
MKPKHRRLIFILGCLVVMAAGTAAILTAFRESMVYFYTPTQLAEKRLAPGFDATRPIRIGGLVKQGSVANLKPTGLAFTITDLTGEVPVTYRGLVPNLFREGQGVVAQGLLGADGSFTAATILAKHDENYMPKNVVDALKASGQWREGEQ